ncbi:hypothetical protein BDW22DRAFT_371920 [Trametopsis cervina]|nr:hypothetical protein BDW22DRAFT_371920 [Trametopsis cervina]
MDGYTASISFFFRWMGVSDRRRWMLAEWKIGCGISGVAVGAPARLRLRVMWVRSPCLQVRSMLGLRWRAQGRSILIVLVVLVLVRRRRVRDLHDAFGEQRARPIFISVNIAISISVRRTNKQGHRTCVFPTTSPGKQSTRTHTSGYQLVRGAFLEVVWFAVVFDICIHRTLDLLFWCSGPLTLDSVALLSISGSLAIRCYVWTQGPTSWSSSSDRSLSHCRRESRCTYGHSTMALFPSYLPVFLPLTDHVARTRTVNGLFLDVRLYIFVSVLLYICPPVPGSVLLGLSVSTSV